MRILGLILSGARLRMIPPHMRNIIKANAMANPGKVAIRSVIKVLNPLSWAERYNYKLGFNGSPQPLEEIKKFLRDGIGRLEYYSLKYGPKERGRLLPMGELLHDGSHWIEE